MSNLGITLGRNGTKWEVISLPGEVPYDQQRRDYKKLRISLKGLYEEIQLWCSATGRVKRQKLDGTSRVQFRAPPTPTSVIPVATEEVAAVEPSSEAPEVELKGLAKVNADRKAAKEAKKKAEAGKPGSSTKPTSQNASKAKPAGKAGKPKGTNKSK